MALEFVSGFIVSSLLQEFVDSIKASAADTIALAFYWDLEKELKSLEASYMEAQSTLDKVDGWDLITNKPHRDWVADVRRACYGIEDFTEHIKLQILKKKGDTWFLRSFWTKWGVSSEIRDLQGALNPLLRVAHQFVASNCRVTDQRHLALNTEPVIVLDDESFRRKQEKENIIRVLLCPTTSSSSSSSVVMIAGMFGLGKTTLAQVVKNDPRIEHHFEHRLWISVSGDFNLGKALCSMIVDLQLEHIQEPDSKLSLPLTEQLTAQQYVRIFQGLCKGRRVLVVLDDLCSFVTSQDWEDFQSIILNTACVLGVVITTRNPKVAAILESVSSVPTVYHYLQRMSDEDCGLILQKKAFQAVGNNQSKRKRCGRSVSEEIALQIAEGLCRGLPLVADVIGRRLSLKQEDGWAVKLSKDYLWEIPEFRELIFPTFRLNYSDLSIFLKNSFPYFSLFPDGYDYKKDELVRLWLAEGYVKPHLAEVEYSEELGNYYFDEVLSCSILQIYHPFDQDPQIYQMHEFIHRYARCIGSDLYLQLDEELVGACSLGNETDILASANITARFVNARHLSLLCPGIPPRVWKCIERYCGSLRTILSLQEHLCIGEVSYALLLKLQSLRVLNLSGADISELPESLGKLEHLRLLDVSKTDIQELPASTAELCELQFLKVDQCPLLLQLPKNMKNLIQLLHLEADMKGLASMPPGIGKLSNLRTLPAFIAGRKDGYRVTELKNLKYLEGSICLTDLENVKDEVEAKDAMLRSKPFLKRLELEWNRYSADRTITEEILAGFEPHENLEGLEVTGYDGARFPSWLSSAECNLTSIRLLRCDGCSILPELGQLQHLKALHIEEMHRVELIDSHFSGRGSVGFPSLVSLHLQDMMSLKKWEGLRATEMPFLRVLVITDCPNLVSLPSLNLLTALVNLEITCCPVMQGLPEEGLPPSVETFIVVKCNVLKQRCLPQGRDWEKIREIPEVVIDFVRVSTVGRKSKSPVVRRS